MATAADISQQRHCSICKNPCEDSVTRSCGHNFCLNHQVDNRDDRECPLCDETLTQAQMDDLSLFYTGKNGEIPCDICEENRPFKAEKSCSTCLLSYCKRHLKQNHSMERLKGHKLVKPEKRLDERACSAHGRPLDLYSTRDKCCICALCVTPGVDVIPVERERKMRETEQQRTIVKLERVIEMGGIKIKDLEKTVRNNVADINREQTEIQKVFAAVMDAVRRAEEELLAPLENGHRSLEREKEEKTRQILRNNEQHKKTIHHLIQTRNEEDDILFLQSYPSVPAELRDDSSVSIDTKLNFGSMRNITTSVLTSINTQLENLCSFEIRRVQRFLVDVILDKETAHPALEVLQDGKTVRVRGNALGISSGPNLEDGVLGRYQIKSGKAFWLVEVGQQSGWKLGVVRENANRTGKVSYKPSDGYWVIVFCDPNTYGAFEDRPVQLHLSNKPKKIGVFVDYENDLISFYNMDDLSHIYTFTQCRFNGTIRPYFNPPLNKDYSDPMIISTLNPTI
ncbi:E3 ubiquitin-protein ligase TRIM21-like [Misgurnus anguillicaudatus]|uniref:E3 ubiquitin-protein ligase TRIM21-like n=1 Tax=Misgurnus anguillicaudatus TaxID=75329 RepID=UPI003CCF2224